MPIGLCHVVLLQVPDDIESGGDDSDGQKQAEIGTVDETDEAEVPESGHYDQKCSREGGDSDLIRQRHFVSSFLSIE